MASKYGSIYGAWDIAGLAEVSFYLRVKRQVVINWRNRYPDFPRPAAELAMGPIWHLCDIRDWARKNEKGPYDVEA